MDEISYQAAVTRAAWRDVSHFGRFRVAGKDAGALLHHLTTNDINRLKPNSVRDAVLVSNKARVLDWLSVFRLADSFLILTSPNRRDLFAPHARRFVLFRQDVQIEDVSESTSMFGLFGPDADKVLSSLCQTSPIEAGEVREFDCAGAAMMAARTQRLPGGGFWLWSSHRESLQQIVQKSGAPLVDAQTYNVLRVESGLPAAGLELSEDVNPWEARLDESISLNKGCYNGQEIIARLNTYQKVKQRLCGLKLETALDTGTTAELKVDGRAAGAITSSVHSPRFGPIALAYVRSEWQQDGQLVQVSASGNMQSATVSDLPFRD
jgi:aminomethyltransferase